MINWKVRPINTQNNVYSLTFIILSLVESTIQKQNAFHFMRKIFFCSIFLSLQIYRFVSIKTKIVCIKQFSMRKLKRKKKTFKSHTREKVVILLQLFNSILSFYFYDSSLCCMSQLYSIFRSFKRIVFDLY